MARSPSPKWSRLGDGFGDPVDVPLWLELNEYSPEEKVGFSRWSIAACDRDKRVMLWSKK